MATVTLDGREFEIEILSDAAKTQLASIRFAESEITSLQSQLAAMQTTRNAYLEALRVELPAG